MMIDNCCTCKIDYGVQSGRNINPALTPALLKGYLLTALTIGDPCVPDNFSDMIDAIWDLMRWQGGCDPELQYLLTRLELIKILMGCKVYDIDRSDTVSESNSRSELVTKQDSESQAQQTGHSSGYSDLIGEQRYNDFADSELRAESQRTAYSESHDESHQRMDDTGHGESVSDTDGTRASKSDRVSEDYSESQSESLRDGARRGYNYNHSASTTEGEGVNLAVLGYARTPTKNSWDQKMRADTSDSSYSSRQGLSSRGLLAEADSSSLTQRKSSSFFNALVDERIWGASISKAEDHQRAQSDSTSHAEGLGQSASEQKGRSQGDSQGTSQSQSLSTTERDGRRNSYSISDTINAHQRFLALRDLFDNTLKMIEYKRTILAARQGYGIIPIEFCLNCGYIPGIFGDPMRARLCQCREPYCPNCSPVAGKIAVTVEENSSSLCM